MVLLETCFCCSLGIAAGFLGVYLMIAYLIAFGFEMLWILESEVKLPTAAILLCAGYFTLSLFGAVLIHGVATKNTLCLVAWIFAVTILAFPEAGLVIFMSIQYWKIESHYGITELVCWSIRITANVIAVVVIQSLYSTWKEEELLSKRLQSLNMMIPIPRDPGLISLSNQIYKNNAYQQSMEDLSGGLKRSTSTSQMYYGTVPNNIAMLPYDMYRFHTQSEFNASIFVPSPIYNEMQTQFLPTQVAGKKSQSLIDLRLLEDSVDDATGNKKQWAPWLSQSITETSSVILPAYNKHKNNQTNINPSLPKYASVDALNDRNRDQHIIRNRTGFYAQPIADYGVPIYYGPLDGPDFLIYKKQIDKINSKNSLSNTSVDDVQKYRDVAL